MWHLLNLVLLVFYDCIMAPVFLSKPFICKLYISVYILVRDSQRVL